MSNEEGISDGWVYDEDVVDYEPEVEDDWVAVEHSEGALSDAAEMEVEPLDSERLASGEAISQERTGAQDEQEATPICKECDQKELSPSTKPDPPAVPDLRDVIEKRKKQKGACNLDRVVEEARSGRAENKGRKRQRAQKLDFPKFIQATSARLQEPKIGLLWRALNILGLEAMQQLLVEVEAIERAGGQLINDGSRRRSPGGVFWNVVKQRVTPEVYTDIFAEEHAKNKFRKKGRPSKKRKSQEAAGVKLENLGDSSERPPVDFKGLVEDVETVSENVEV